MGKLTAPALVLGTLLILGMFYVPSADAKQSKAPTFPEFPLLFHVAQAKGKPVRSANSLKAQVSRANAIFKTSGVRFVQVGSPVLLPTLSQVRTRRDRHALVEYLQPNLINCFMVEELRNVDEPGVIRGVHWRSTKSSEGGNKKVHYVIVSKIASVSVLAHELGHFFGNKHSDTPGNVMSYSRGEGLPFFDATQIKRIRRFAKRFRTSGEIALKAE